MSRKNSLREIRRRRGLSQLALAKRSNVSPNDISRIENGRVEAWPGWRKRLAKALSVPELEVFPAGESEMADDDE